jgi:subtilisin family serine protease/subtilisin-like proprotein convertase family protein
LPCNPSRHRRPLLEPLEDRRLLAAAPVPDLSLLDNPSLTREHRPGSLIVQFRDGASAPGSLSAHLITANLAPEWQLTPGMRQVDLTPAADWDAALLTFRQDPNVLFAEPDYRITLQKEPNDPSYPALHALNNTGAAGTADADIDAPEAWEITTGDHETIVAVIDTGVDYTHPDLAANIWINTDEIPGNGIDDDNNGYIDDRRGYDFANRDSDPMDDHFHGTHVAGTIGAVGDNGLGIVGVNWHVQIMPLKFLDAGGAGYESDAIAALNYAVANGAVVSNNSWGGGGFSPAFQTALQNAANQGHIFVAAAGNLNLDNDTFPFYPASYNVDNVISVAATDASDNLAYFSNYGEQSVDLAAPGANILSTFPTRLTDAMRNAGFSTNYQSISGTSMAAPHVTGVIALISSLHPDWTYDQIIDQVLGTVDLIPGLATVTGGRVNAASAVDNPAPDTNGPRIITSDPAAVAFGTLTHVRLRFSESIDLATIGLEDVFFTGPSGAIPVLSIAPAFSSSRQFDVTFEPQTAVGEYTLLIGPDIADNSGNLMNQDGDELFGEFPDDQYTVSFTMQPGTQFTSGNLPPIPVVGFSIVGSPIVIEQDIAIGDLNVTVNLAYPDVRHLLLLLISPGGTGIFLSVLDGAEGPGFIYTTFDDEAQLPLAAGEAPFTDSYRPTDPFSGMNQPLSAFDGQSTLGQWQLWVQNYTFTDAVGELHSWSIQVTAAASGPPPGGDNAPPVPGNDEIELPGGGPMTFAEAFLLANDFDPDGDTIVIIGVNQGSGGFVQLNGDATITFTPNEEFIGVGDFEYIASDGFHTAVGHVSVNVVAQFLWHNSLLAVDVDDDGVVSANDVISVINVINSVGSTSLVGLSTLGLSATSSPDTYIDVNADNYVGADDVLAIINYINANPNRPTIAQVSSFPTQPEIDAALLSLLTDNPTKKK